MRNIVSSLASFGLPVVAAVGLSMAAMAPAHATVFAATATFVDQTTGNALTVQANPNPANLTTTNLVANQSYYKAGFMTLTTQDSQGADCFLGGLLGCSVTDKVALTFAWTSPSTAANTQFSGSVTETTFDIAKFDNGNLEWAHDDYSDSNGTYAKQLVTFADGAQAEIDLYDTCITGTTSAEAAQFDVRVIDKKDPIPEPMSLALLGSGVAGLGMITRRRRAGKTEAQTA